jgi:hypothetical protein
MRLVLATFVLVGSLGSSPTFGHAHEGGDSDHRHLGHHLGHHLGSELGHDADHHDGLHEEHDGSEWLARRGIEYHLHGVLFGIPFTVPNPSAQLSSTSNPFLLADDCPTLIPAFGVSHLLKERIPWPVDWGVFDLALGIASGTASHRSTYRFDSFPPSCSPQARSVVLRC